MTRFAWQPSARLIAGAIAAATLVFLALVYMLRTGTVTDTASAGIAVVIISAFAALGVFAARAARARSAGLEARVWRLVGYGLLSWALGSIPYLLFLSTGGDIRNPAAWSQAGFLLAYPFWYRALWLLRQPPIEESRAGRAETWAIEGAVFLMVGVIVVGIIWYGGFEAARNVALLVPVTLDLLLLASLYNAARRSTVTHGAAVIWFAYAFGVLALTDGAVSYLVPRASTATTGMALLGYAVAMGLMTIAARRPLRVTETRAAMGPSKTVLAAIGVALCGPASAVAAPAARPVIWAVAALLFWRLWTHLKVHGRSDTDTLTGFLEPRAFGAHLGGVMQGAGGGRRAALIAVDLDGFARWNGQHGYGAGDALVAEVSARLDASPLTGGAWGRLGPDRFAWVGSGIDARMARELAEVARAAAADNPAGLGARAAFVILPDDAATTANALAAAEEALGAARAGRRPVVAFDLGRLDGVEYSAEYTASLAQRRGTITEVLHAPSSIDTVFQPIVCLTTGRTVGFEALSRFRAQPERTPDRWIAEAHAVGLGLEVEVECVRRAFRLRGSLPGDAYMSVNMSPDAVLSPEMESVLGGGSLEGLVIEITEHDAVGDYAPLAARRAEYRGRGALVAIDDTGAGHSSMRHVTQLAPDYIKIDRSLIRDVHLDHAKRALVRSLVTLERDLGASIVAEGIESASELRALRELGVPLGQGYLLARPLADPVPAPWHADAYELSGSG